MFITVEFEIVKFSSIIRFSAVNYKSFSYKICFQIIIKYRLLNSAHYYIVLEVKFVPIRLKETRHSTKMCSSQTATLRPVFEFVQ